MSSSPVTYLPGVDLADFETRFLADFPQFADALWMDRPGAAQIIERLNGEFNEFDDDAGSGRGDSYRFAQESAGLPRIEGTRRLLELALPHGEVSSALTDARVLDVLGGDGVVARTHATLWPGASQPVLTSDLSGKMIADALERGHAAMRQAAEFLLLRECSMTAVLLAYGTHHIPPDRRPLAYAEAHRVLRPGGRVVVHDFAEGSPVARWFAEIVDRFCPAGHAYEHFEAEILAREVEAAGFQDVVTSPLDDPVQVVGATEEDAQNALLDHLIAMYGLRLLDPASGREDLRAWIMTNMADDPEFGSASTEGIVVRHYGDRYLAEMPRRALVAVGTKV